MSDDPIIEGMRSVENVSRNAARLSEIASSFEKLGEDLRGLAGQGAAVEKLLRKGTQKVDEFNGLLGELESRLAVEIKVRVAENMAEQMSRIKDANEKIDKLSQGVANLESRIGDLTDSVEKSLEKKSIWERMPGKGKRF